ncbi:MAG: ATP-binding protein [Carbonactinosporaceae bacterium]
MTAIIRAFPGDPASLAEARAWVAGLLAHLPVVDDAVLVVSELATNALAHTASARGGYTVAVRICGPDRLRLSVSDLGSPTPPMLADPDTDTESGRGLRIVAAITVRWGVCASHAGRSVWAELEWKPG